MGNAEDTADDQTEQEIAHGEYLERYNGDNACDAYTQCRQRYT